MERLLSLDMSPEKMASRAEDRKCGSCELCDRETHCGWRQGLFASRDNPERLGVMFGARVLGSGEGVELLVVMSAEETRKGALDSIRGNMCLRAVGERFPVVVANLEGEVLGVLGRDDRAREVLERLKETVIDGDEVEKGRETPGLLSRRGPATPEKVLVP